MLVNNSVPSCYCVKSSQARCVSFKSVYSETQSYTTRIHVFVLLVTAYIRAMIRAIFYILVFFLNGKMS